MFFTNHQIPCLDTFTVFRCVIEGCPIPYTSKCYLNDKRREDKIGGVCWQPWEERKIHTGSLYRNHRDRKQLGNLRLYERVILTQTLKKQNGTARTGSSYSG